MRDGDEIPEPVAPQPYRHYVATVRVSTVRFRSLLANRRMSADDVAERVATVVSPHALASTDQDVASRISSR